MNEKIKQFAELSKAYKTILVDGKMQSVLLIDPERFAGMIVRECADIATMNQFQWDSAGEYVLKHFGIEPDVNENLRNRGTYFGNDV
jgi:hypothetical protein